MDKITLNQNIISFDYNEGYYRAIHSNYGYWVSNAVKMKYLGDSSKDIFMSCYIGVGEEYRTNISPTLLHFYIPCTIEDRSLINEGTYCIEIVKTLIGDINSGDFCSNSLTFKVTKSSNIPTLSVTGFALEQSGCVQAGDTVTLLATVNNKMSLFQDYYGIGIGLSNTEEVSADIPLDCKIEGQKTIGSTDRIICKIPNSISEGQYSILYSSNFLESYECPINIINDFNSLNFNGQVKKLNIFKGNIGNIESILKNISIVNDIIPVIRPFPVGIQTMTPINIPYNENVDEVTNQIYAKFKLTFYLDSINNIDYFTLDIYKDKNIEIKLSDKSREIIDIQCQFIKSNEFSYIFDLICSSNSFEKNKRYSIVIPDDIIIGYDTSVVLCTYGDSTLYKKIIIPAAEYDILIAFDEDNSPYFDCNTKNYGYYLSGITKIQNYCGSCNNNCTICKGTNICTKCLEGFSLDYSNKCVIIRDRIYFDKFGDVKDFIPFKESCENTNLNKQLFSFKFDYYINEGDNFAISPLRYDNVIAGKSVNGNYKLNCIIDVNPLYEGNSEQYFGYCKQTICSLTAYVNCSFQEKVPNGIYDIQINFVGDFGDLLNTAKAEYQPIEINYVDTKLSATIISDKIRVAIKGYTTGPQPVYLCPEINSYFSECYEILNCERLTYDSDNGETIFECPKTIDYEGSSCKTFNRILMEDYCRNNINESFIFQYCPEHENYSNLSFGNLYILLIIILISI